MSPETQKQFGEEHRLVLAVAAQIYPVERDVQLAVSLAIQLIKESELELKLFYEQESQSARKSVGQQEIKSTGTQPSVAPEVPTQFRREVANCAIKEYSEVIVAKKLRSINELRAMVSAYGVNKKEDLSNDQATELLNKLREISKGEKKDA